MADLSIAYVGMSDVQLETTDDTTVEISVSNNTDQKVVLTAVRYGTQSSGIDFCATQNGDYAGGHEAVLGGESHVIAPGASISLTVSVRTQAAAVGSPEIDISIDYEFTQVQSPFEDAFAITVSPD